MTDYSPLFNSLYKKGFVTASADQTVKFWSFEALKAEGWSVVHTRTLQLQEDALAVKLSPNGLKDYSYI